MNIDMLYYVKNMPTMKRLKDVEFDVDKYTSAQQYLFEDEGLDGSYRIRSSDFNNDEEDIKVETFTNEIQKNWGKQESQLRTAIYVSFIKDTDTHLFRKKLKKRRSTSERAIE